MTPDSSLAHDYSKLMVSSLAQGGMSKLNRWEPKFVCTGHMKRRQQGGTGYFFV